MLKKSRVVAVLAVCVMMFTVVQPVFARSARQVAEDTAEGAVVGAGTGAFIGAFLMGVAVIATGGLAAVPLAGAAIGGAAVTGATYGAVGGGVAGAVGGKEGINQYVNDVTQGAGEQTVRMGTNKNEAQNFIINNR